MGRLSEYWSVQSSARWRSSWGLEWEMWNLGFVTSWYLHEARFVVSQGVDLGWLAFLTAASCRSSVTEGHLMVMSECWQRWAGRTWTWLFRASLPPSFRCVCAVCGYIFEWSSSVVPSSPCWLVFSQFCNYLLSISVSAPLWCVTWYSQWCQSCH